MGFLFLSLHPAARHPSAASRRHHTLNITRPTSHTQHHAPNITHSTSHSQHHTPNITQSTPHTQHHTPNMPDVALSWVYPIFVLHDTDLRNFTCGVIGSFNFLGDPFRQFGRRTVRGSASSKAWTGRRAKRLGSMVLKYLLRSRSELKSF